MFEDKFSEVFIKLLNSDSNIKIKELQLKNCMISDNFLIELEPALSKNRTLIKLDLT